MPAELAGVSLPYVGAKRLQKPIDFPALSWPRLAKPKALIDPGLPLEGIRRMLRPDDRPH